MNLSLMPCNLMCYRLLCCSKFYSRRRAFGDNGSPTASISRDIRSPPMTEAVSAIVMTKVRRPGGRSLASCCTTARIHGLCAVEQTTCRCRVICFLSVVGSGGRGTRASTLCSRNKCASAD